MNTSPMTLTGVCGKFKVLLLNLCLMNSFFLLGQTCGLDQLKNRLCRLFMTGQISHVYDMLMISNLIVLKGLINEEDPMATHYYAFRSGRFELVKRVPAKK